MLIELVDLSVMVEHVLTKWKTSMLKTWKSKPSVNPVVLLVLQLQ